MLVQIYWFMLFGNKLVFFTLCPLLHLQKKIIYWKAAIHVSQSLLPIVFVKCCLL